MTPILQLAGRILASAIFIWAGWGKLLGFAATTGYFEKIGLPMPPAAAAFAVFVELAVGLALLAGLFTRLSGGALAVWCIATALVGHSNFADRNMEIHFMKNVAMCGGLLYVVAFGAGVYSVDALLARRSAGVRAVA